MAKQDSKNQGRKGGSEKIWAGVAGALDPLLRKAAQRIAAKVPEDSILRSEILETAVGVVKGLAEAISAPLPPSLKVMVEKATDFSDFFAGALGGVAGPAVEDWMKKFFTESGKRLREAQDPLAEFEKAKLEFKLRGELLELINQSVPKKEPLKPLDWRDGWKWLDEKAKKTEEFASKAEVNTKLESVLERTRAWARKANGGRDDSNS